MVMTKLRMFKNQKKKAPPTHIAQMITIKTRKNLDAMCKKTKLSRPMQLEKIVQDALFAAGISFTL